MAAFARSWRPEDLSLGVAGLDFGYYANSAEREC